MDLDFFAKFEKVRAEKRKKGLEYATAKGLSWQMQKLEGIILARKTKELIGQGMAVGRAEVEAKASAEYEAHVLGTAEAIREEHTKRAEYENLESHFEELRSLCSLEKSTRNLEG